MVFDGKQVVVTGGANGIGLSIAKSFLAAGGSVWVFDLAAESPLRAAEAIGARGCVADVTDLASLEDAFDDVGAVPDVVVINAGMAKTASLFDTTTKIWDDTLAVNLSGAFHTLQCAARRMKAVRRGAIVLTASTNSFDGEADLVAYNASKAGLLGLLHTAANELGPYGIRVNAVCPGLIRTRLTASSFSDPRVVEPYFRQIALGRGGEPEEVANAVLFLASDAASYITGTTLTVDGGQMAAKFGTWGLAGDRFDGQRWTRGE